MQTTSGHQRSSYAVEPVLARVKEIFEPEDLQPIIGEIRKTARRHVRGDIVMTTCGSPMSSTFSFSVLNGFGLAAKLRAGAQLGRCFGDDYLGVGKEEEHGRVDLYRTELGLRTKKSATGVATRAPIPGTSNLPLAVFTERFLDLTTLRFLPSAKPRGLVALYRAFHPLDVIAPGVAYIQDYEGLGNSLERDLPAYFEACVRNPNEEIHLQYEYPVRRTTSRNMVQSALHDSLDPFAPLLTVKSGELFLSAVEASLLTIVPSTRGMPERETNVSHPLRKNYITTSVVDSFIANVSFDRAFVGFTSNDVELDYEHPSFDAFIRAKSRELGLHPGLPLEELIPDIAPSVRLVAN
jgi:hypothetical protein